MPKKEIYVLIVENPQLAKVFIREHMDNDGITYAAVFKEESRYKIIEALDPIE